MPSAGCLHFPGAPGQAHPAAVPYVGSVETLLEVAPLADLWAMVAVNNFLGGLLLLEVAQVAVRLEVEAGCRLLLLEVAQVA